MTTKQTAAQREIAVNLFRAAACEARGELVEAGILRAYAELLRGLNSL